MPPPREPPELEVPAPKTYVPVVWLVCYALAGALSSIILIAGFGAAFFQEAARDFIGPLDPQHGSWQFFADVLLNNLSVAGIVVASATAIQLMVHAGHTGDLYYGARTFTDVLLSVILVRNLLVIGIAIAAWPAQILQAIALHATAEVSAFVILAVLYIQARRKAPLSLGAMSAWIGAAVICIVIGAALEGLT